MQPVNLRNQRWIHRNEDGHRLDVPWMFQGCFCLQVQENVAVERTSNGAEPRVEVAFEGDKDYPTHDGAGYESQGLLEGLLQDQPARREAGEDLMLWLELREQNQLGSSEEALPTSEEMVEIVDGMVNSHQQAAEVCYTHPFIRAACPGQSLALKPVN